VDSQFLPEMLWDFSRAFKALKSNVPRDDRTGNGPRGLCRFPARWTRVPPMKWAAVIIGIIGALAIVAAIIYYTVPAHSLPSFMGTLHLHTKAKRVKRGEAALIAGIVLLIIAGVLVFVDIRNTRRASYT
jgi:hypothetical protein